MKLKVTISFLLVTLVFSDALAGSIVVTDGDGLRLNGERIRLWGIDAPELGQSCARGGTDYPCGEEARDMLGALVMGGRVTCEKVNTDRYRRTVARCHVNGRDLGAEMVRQGWAVDYPRYSRGHYAAEQAEAERHRRGLWAGTFVLPWEWRR
jgi:endonuclease YncB( thermonuclease family)